MWATLLLPELRAGYTRARNAVRRLACPTEYRQWANVGTRRPGTARSVRSDGAKNRPASFRYEDHRRASVMTSPSGVISVGTCPRGSVQQAVALGAKVSDKRPSACALASTSAIDNGRPRRPIRSTRRSSSLTLRVRRHRSNWPGEASVALYASRPIPHVAYPALAVYQQPFLAHDTIARSGESGSDYPRHR